MAYESIAGPLGPDRDDHLAALIASTVVNSMRSKGRARKLSEFLPQWGPKQEQDPRQQLQTASALAKALGGDFVMGGGFDHGNDR